MLYRLAFLVAVVAACGGVDAQPVGDPGADAAIGDPGVDGGDGDAPDKPEDPPGSPARFKGKFSSPTIVRDGGIDHAYFAKQGIRVSGAVRMYHVPHATYDATTGWSLPVDVLPHLGSAARADGPVWAPSVAKIADGRWMLYYTAEPAGLPAGSQKKCLFRAHATSPTGPFVDDYGAPLWCQPGTLWAIDAYAVRDAQGNWHVAARLDLGDGINSIQIRKLTPDGARFETGSTWHLLARNEQGSWDQHVMENAGVVRLAPPGGAPPHWFVFYSARHWEDDSYAIGYADCGENIDGLTAPGCIKRTPAGPWLATKPADDLYGPGTPTFYGGLMSIQAWHYPDGVVGSSADAVKNRAEGQIMRTYDISIDDDYRPRITLRRVDL